MRPRGAALSSLPATIPNEARWLKNPILFTYFFSLNLLSVASDASWHDGSLAFPGEIHAEYKIIPTMDVEYIVKKTRFELCLRSNIGSCL